METSKAHAVLILDHDAESRVSWIAARRAVSEEA